MIVLLIHRANQNGWDAVSQFDDRASTLERNGHTIDKIELLVLGGTWSSYPRDYQEEFVRDLFYAANTYSSREGKRRERLSLEEEQRINETCESRIIGLTLETRPDFINKYELRLLRRYGCTRVQLGIQHTDNDILKYINRGCTREDGIKAVHLLKDSGFKVDIHIMPDLPSSNVEKDRAMFDYIINTPYLQVLFFVV
jgi:ELP3 family radical SAM enzyme/protein acetyltransferase